MGASFAFAICGGGGYLLLLWVAKFSCVSARFSSESLLLTAPSGHLLGGNGKLCSASIPWSALQGMRTFEVPATEGVPDHRVCFLYSTLGDFTLHSLHWDRHGELVAALIAHSGRTPGQPLPSRPGTKSHFTTGERITLTVFRILGWVGLAGSFLFFWFLAENFWRNGLNWSGAGMLTVLATLLVGSYSLTRIRTQ